MDSTALYFTAPGRIELRHEPIPQPGSGQVLVETILSGISSGTEMLVYRGQFPRQLSDSNDQLSSGLKYPLTYGYASVGRVSALGPGVDQSWLDRRVFAFHPHSSHYLASPDSLLAIPEGLDPSNAVFLPNMETAVNLVQDAEPLLGETVVVLGQGVVGLLVASLLHEFPVQRLVTADRFDLRRRSSMEIGVDASLDPTFDDFRASALRSLPSSLAGFDLTLELSGNPSALDDAVALTGFGGRIIIGSWYGEKRAPIDLGGKFHRSRISISSSQVSTISPKLTARWTKSRRFDVAWDAIQRIQPRKWITHQIKFAEAADAYRLLDQSPEQSIQVMLSY